MSKQKRVTVPGSWGERVMIGAMAGVTGACCMDLVRFAARRAGVIDRRIPEQVARRVRGTTGSRPVSAVGRATLERALHLGYGASLAAGFAALSPRASLGRGALFGIGTWLLGSAVVLPALRTRHPFWRASVSENAVDVAAHLIFGVVTTWGLTELADAAGAAIARPGSAIGEWGRVG